MAETRESTTGSRTSPAGNRVSYLDSACGILIINMIAYHCWQWTDQPSDAAWLRIFSFFMPWFFFKAGMFYKPAAIGLVAKKGLKRLLRPYILYTVTGILVLWVSRIYMGEESNLLVLCRRTVSSIILKSGSAAGNLPLWFLLSLFFSRILFALIDKKIKRNQWLLVLLPLTLHFILQIHPFSIPYYVTSTLSGLAFYAIGYCFRNYNPPVKWTVVLAAVYAVTMTFAPQMVDMHYDKVISGTYIGWFAVSTIGILAFNAVSRLTLNNRNVLSWIGEKSLDFYCWHWMVLILISAVLSSFDITGIHCFFIELALIALILYLLEMLKQAIRNRKKKG